MGGSTIPNDNKGVVYEVMTVNLTTKEVGEAADTIEGVSEPAATSSFNRIVLCGGEREGKPLKCCQIYSPRSDT